MFYPEHGPWLYSTEWPVLFFLPYSMRCSHIMMLWPLPACLMPYGHVPSFMACAVYLYPVHSTPRARLILPSAVAAVTYVPSSPASLVLLWDAVQRSKSSPPNHCALWPVMEVTQSRGTHSITVPNIRGVRACARRVRAVLQQMLLCPPRARGLHCISSMHRVGSSSKLVAFWQTVSCRADIDKMASVFLT